jgi:hypothetical protein
MSEGWYIFGLIGFAICLCIGLGLLIFTNRIMKWNADMFSLTKKDDAGDLSSKHGKPQTVPYRSDKLLTWCFRVIGAGLVALCALAIYNIASLLIE